MRFSTRRAAAPCLALLLVAAPVLAVITALTPLAGMLEDPAIAYILVAAVEKLDTDRPAMALTVGENLKGKAPFGKLVVHLKGDTEADKAKQMPQLLKRLAPKLPLVLFVSPRDKDYTALAYTNGTWFQLTGTDDAGATRWAFTHCEPYLRRTYKGTTTEMRQVIVDALAGKKKPPEVNPKEKPGLGPEIEPAKKEEAKPDEKRGAAVAAGPLFAVIPSVLVGGPLAVLAMLFPAVFGGLIVVLKRWTAALTVLSLNSTLYLAWDWFGERLAGSWWGTPLAVWLTMCVIALLGTLWAWRRHITYLSGGAGFETPRVGELIVLGLCSAACIVAAILWMPHALTKLSLWDKTLTMFAGGVWAATLFVVYQRFVAARRRAPRPSLPPEGVLLWAMALVGTGFAATLGGSGSILMPTDASESSVQFVKATQLFRPNAPCWIASSPALDGGCVYVAAVHGSAFRSGALYCLDADAGALRWSFNNGGKMKDAFSSPCVAGGKVYIGEGFHQDLGCQLYCLDADTGKKLWEFATASHTESTPCVAGGKVYFGAGDDGLYCLDAASGEKLWQMSGLHVDANPLVVDGRLYCGSGIGDVYKDTAVFCLDAVTGKEQWRIPTDLPVWGALAHADGQVYVGTGNGNFLASANELEVPERPAGAVLGLDAATGQRIWRYDTPDGVHVRLLAAGGNVWFASRDGHAYCVAAKDGAPRWKVDLGSPIVASPALAGVNVYLAASDGRICCLDAATGKVEWSFDVQKDTGLPVHLFSSPTVAVQGSKRRIYLGSGLNNFTRGVLYCLEDACHQ